jgi:hypothetical protein
MIIRIKQIITRGGGFLNFPGAKQAWKKEIITWKAVFFNFVNGLIKE